MKKYILVLLAVLIANVNVALAEVAPTINVSSHAAYYDEKIIPSNIRSSCTDLGSNFSKYAKSFIEKNGTSVTLKPNMNKTDDGKNLILQITNASSSGNAFIGHKKSVSIEAELYENGKLVDKYSGTRSSGGGMGGAFKGSCSVLNRCVNTLGKDVAKWLKKIK